MYFTESYTSKHDNQQAIEQVNRLVERMNQFIKTSTAGRYDLMITLPCGHNPTVCFMLSCEPWTDFHVPQSVFSQAVKPDLLWFAYIQDDEIVNIQSLKFSAFQALAIEPHAGTKVIQTRDMIGRIEHGTSPAISFSLIQHCGFGDERRKCYILRSDLLLDAKVGFSFHEFNVNLDDSESVFWIYVHVSAAMQSTKFSVYPKLWDGYQTFLSR